jgi:hypothetical protein
MSPSIKRAAGTIARRSPAGIAVALLLIGLTGCGLVNKVNQIRHNIEGNRAIIDSFTKGLKNTKATPFQVTYVTTGSSPTTVTYAVRPPTGISFQETGNNGGAAQVDLVSNASGEYSCSQPTTGAQWSCQKLGKASAIAQNELFSIYTPSHWVDFLEGVSFVAGLSGDKVTTSSMTVNGFSMHCVDFVAKGVKGTSTICTTAQNILGYVKVASEPTSFEIKSYTSSPPASAFALPPGAKVVSQSS